MNTLYLGSNSPRRMQLLTQLGYHVIKLPADIDEAVKANETPACYVQRMAAEKNQTALALFLETNGAMPDFPLITADTCVVSDGIILGNTPLPSRSGQIPKTAVGHQAYRPDIRPYPLSRQCEKLPPNQPRRLQAPEFGRNFRHGTSNYLNRVLTQTQNKVNVAGERYWEVQAPLQKASQKYGVQQEYLLALWGMESSFGHYQGKYDVLSAVATLAFEGRREKLFTKEFISAMKMLEKDHIQRERMLGSWAGAMGQTQFMPSTFLRYAADGNNDGVKDIWKNQFDTFASIANYLHTVGWDNSLPWGVEVMLTQPIDLSYSGTESNKARSLKDWQTMGIILKSANPQEQAKLSTLENAQLWLVRPDREAGRAFLVSNNFRTILDWNKSNYFALSIGMFVERIKDNL